MKRSVQGFTLLELLVVIVLLVMAISVTTVSIVSGQGGARMKTSARQLLSVLRSARTRAITEGVEAGITLGVRVLNPDDQGDDRLSSNKGILDYKHSADEVGQRSGFESPDRSYTIIPSNQTVTLVGELSLSLTSSGQEGIVPPASVLFYPDGSSSGGSLVLRAPSGEMTIDINWLTGEVVLDKAFATARDSAQTAALP